MKKQFLVLFIATSMMLCSCSIARKPIDNEPIDSNSNNVSSPTPEDSPDSTDTLSPQASPDTSDDVDKLLSTLTLEEKIGQMFFIASRTNKEGQRQLSMDDSLKNTLEKYMPGGFIFFAENLDTVPQTVSFIDSLQKTSKIPMFIGIDEEGGIVTRLNKAEGLHSTVMPEPFVIGQTGKEEYAYKASRAIADEIKSLGFNLNFAPVADVFSNPNNTVIGKRAYSSDAELAAQMVAEAVKGAKYSGIIPVLKHFPGHGDTLQDSHTGIAIVENDIERLRQVEFLPFKAGIDAGAEMVMTAHVLTPKITGNELPATLSKPILQDILRKELGFEGIIITDGLEMSAISSYFDEEEAVVMAVEAGVDILLLPIDLDKSYNAILSAVNEGRLTEQRIDESVRRILKVKLGNIIKKPPVKLDPEKVLGSQQHRDLAEQIRKDSK